MALFSFFLYYTVFAFILRSNSALTRGTLWEQTGGVDIGPKYKNDIVGIFVIVGVRPKWGPFLLASRGGKGWYATSCVCKIFWGYIFVCKLPTQERSVLILAIFYPHGHSQTNKQTTNCGGTLNMYLLFVCLVGVWSL